MWFLAGMSMISVTTTPKLRDGIQDIPIPKRSSILKRSALFRGTIIFRFFWPILANLQMKDWLPVHGHC